MQASFLLKRELNHKVECARLRSPNFYPHFHSNLEIYLILSGEIEVLVNDQKKLLGAGEFAVSLSYDTHGYRTPKEAEAIFLSIPTSVCEEFLPLLSGRRLPSHYINDPVLFQTVLDAMETLIAGCNEISEKGLVYIVLGAIYGTMLPKSEAADLPSRGNTADILIYINEHFREELTLPQIARAFGYHEGYFSRYFRGTFGISFIRYLTMVRLREAVLLLQSGKRTVTESAMESGFGSMRSFYRAFYKEFGNNPTDYLKHTNENK